ncbi:flavin reductase (DIM6/NTAB) family NADH-FMN oxidoreductase RutF [Sulfitobacter undariae]|uniref:Flavin reductase (DIM6/NTAB) family NADH-FMN oxidoreductase RutF n=1 Tax=Sulfitobacter undariae TaxID=1563671 RepID=A0A7W6E5I0_9RHOB|nr:flavin reductase family protein [Sulfitobacter undariae]MBB3995137.1 flavin reductase (DIM6/NTAB) family NADH-FMN oxidoreductase RutF [Sulfitobacter undariae]
MKTDMQSFVPDPARTTDLRRALGQFGTGVALITAQTDAGPIGMTANSFSSVSLDPPLVLWSAACSSKRHDAFAQTAAFCIHVLSAEQIELANHFATQGHDFSPYPWDVGPNGAPTLHGCLATFHCDTYAVHPAGDHSIILGQITSAAIQPVESDGLLFKRGRFGRFAPDQ